MKCACCRKIVKPDDVAAQAISGDEEVAWCFDCWDNNPTALHQYQSFAFGSRLGGNYHSVKGEDDASD